VKTQEQPIEQFWEMTEGVAAGMLGVSGSGQHMQPMQPNVDRDNRSIWFFAKRDSDIVKAAREGEDAHFCVVGKHHDYHACVRGTVHEGVNELALDRFWDAVIEAWFNEKHDPNLTMIELRLTDGIAWASTSNAAAFGWEIVKANLSMNEPDAGIRRQFTFLNS
jgi:general stress protein 26